MMTRLLFTVIFVLSLVILGTVEAAYSDNSTSYGDGNEGGNIFRHRIERSDSVNKLNAMQTCGIITFSVYNSTSNATNELQAYPYFFDYPKGRIMLDTYPNGMISIITNVDTSACPKATTIRCVNTTFGTFRQSIERTAPYTLYGDNPVTGHIVTRKPARTGYQLLSANAYTTQNCTGKPIAETINDIHLVPVSVAAIRSSRFNTIYNGTMTPSTGVPAKDTNAIVTATCEYIRGALGYGFIYKQSINFGYYSFKCFRVMTSTQGNITTTNATLGALQITYQIIATFSVYEIISPYLNPDMPSSQQLSNHITALLLNQRNRGPQDDMYMSDSLRNRIVAPNVYWNFTNIVLG